MGKRKARGLTPNTWESTGGWKAPDGNVHKDTAAVIWKSALMSPAMQRLTPRQQMLYVLCKEQCIGTHKPRQDYSKEYMKLIAVNAGVTVDELYHDRVFYFSWSDAQQYALYHGVTNRKVFERDMKALHRAGFIEVLQRGVNHYAKTIYRLSDEWREKHNEQEE